MLMQRRMAVHALAPHASALECSSRSHAPLSLHSPPARDARETQAARDARDEGIRETQRCCFNLCLGRLSLSLHFLLLLHC